MFRVGPQARQCKASNVVLLKAGGRERGQGGRERVGVVADRRIGPMLGRVSVRDPDGDASHARFPGLAALLCFRTRRTAAGGTGTWPSREGRPRPRAVPGSRLDARAGEYAWTVPRVSVVLVRRPP